MIWFMLLIGIIGCTMMAFADPLTEPPSLPSKSLQKPGTITDAIMDMWEVCTMRKSMVLAPTILLQGCNLAFVFGNYPKFVSGGDSIEVAAVFLCFGKELISPRTSCAAYIPPPLYHRNSILLLLLHKWKNLRPLRPIPTPLRLPRIRNTNLHPRTNRNGQPLNTQNRPNNSPLLRRLHLRPL